MPLLVLYYKHQQGAVMQVSPKRASQNFNLAVDKVAEIERLVIATLGPDTDVTCQYLRMLDELRDDLVADIVEFDDGGPV